MASACRVVVLASLLTLLAAASAGAQTAQVAKPGPEQQALAAFVSTMACEFSDSGGRSTSTQTCEMVDGGFFLQCHSRNSLGVEGTLIGGYAPGERAYTMYRHATNGLTDIAKGWKHGDTWTYVFENERTADNRPRRRQVTIVNTAATMTVKWEASVEGEPWHVTQQGTCTKGAPTPSGGR